MRRGEWGPSTYVVLWREPGGQTGRVGPFWDLAAADEYAAFIGEALNKNRDHDVSLVRVRAEREKLCTD